jgi:hypothetical protein
MFWPLVDFIRPADGYIVALEKWNFNALQLTVAIKLCGGKGRI